MRRTEGEQCDSITVVDAGAGIGILGVMALLHGADHVIFLENNPETIALCQEFVSCITHAGIDQHRTSTADQCNFLLADATTVRLPCRPQMLISETITTGFIEEDFPNIISNLVPQLANNALIIPQSFTITDTTRQQTISSIDFQRPSKLTGTVKMGY